MSDETKAPEVARVWHTVERGRGILVAADTQQTALRAQQLAELNDCRAITVIEQPDRDEVLAIVAGICAAMTDEQQGREVDALLRLLGHDA